MPHAEADTTASSMPLVNGEKRHSKAFDHITSYPVVSDGITFYKSIPYGQKSISFAQGAFDRFGRPITPYLTTPYSYVAPYLNKADSLADDGLSRVDARFPIVREDTEKLKASALDVAGFPLRLVGQGRDYLFGTWSDEYGKTKGEGVVRYAKAAVSTELKIALDGYHFLLSMLSKGKEQGKQAGDKMAN